MYMKAVRTFHGVLLCAAIAAVVIFARPVESFEEPAEPATQEVQATKLWNAYIASYRAKLKPAEKARFKKTYDLVGPKVLGILSQASVVLGELNEECKIALFGLLFAGWSELKEIRLTKENKSVIQAVAKDIWQNVGK